MTAFLSWNLQDSLSRELSKIQTTVGFAFQEYLNFPLGVMEAPPLIIKRIKSQWVASATDINSRVDGVVKYKHLSLFVTQVRAPIRYTDNIDRCQTGSAAVAEAKSHITAEKVSLLITSFERVSAHELLGTLK